MSKGASDGFCSTKFDEAISLLYHEVITAKVFEILGFLGHGIRGWILSRDSNPSGSAITPKIAKADVAESKHTSFHDISSCTACKCLFGH